MEGPQFQLLAMLFTECRDGIFDADSTAESQNSAPARKESVKIVIYLDDSMNKPNMGDSEVFTVNEPGGPITYTRVFGRHTVSSRYSKKGSSTSCVALRDRTLDSIGYRTNLLDGKKCLIPGV